MNVPVSLTFTDKQYSQLRKHLFPGDNKEAVAFALCGFRKGSRRHRLIAQRIYEIPHSICLKRNKNIVTWPTDSITELLDEAEKRQLSLVKIHSHPSGYADFSERDARNDNELLPIIKEWVGNDLIHGSAIMLPSGEIFGKTYPITGEPEDLYSVNVVGHDLKFWYSNTGTNSIPDFMASHAQAFDEGTIHRLRKLSIAVIGCSGTGSPVVEQLVRLGVKEIVLIDDDIVEDRNVNRLINSTLADATNNKSKVDCLSDAIHGIGLGTKVVRINSNLWNPAAIRAAAQCDIVFGCMDTVDGRYLLNLLSTYYSIPYFDIGIRLDANLVDNKNSIREVCGSIHYLQPGLSSLMSRGLFNMAHVSAAGLMRNDPAAYKHQLEVDGYISGVENHRPAVISINMLAASLAVHELLARLHPYREEPSSHHGSVTFSLASMEMISESEQSQIICSHLSGFVGHGDTTPLLGLMDLIERDAA